MFGLRVTLFQRGAAGVPSTTQLATDISGQLSSIECTTCAVGGFESFTAPMRGATPNEFIYWGQQLGSGIRVTGPDGRTAWEGILVGVDGTFGQEQRSVSLEPMINAVKMRYTTPAGYSGGVYPSNSTFQNDVDSQAFYGVKQAVLSAGIVRKDDAGNACQRALKQWAFPRAQANSTVSTGDMGESDITLHGAGWYYCLDWLTLSDLSTTVTSTTTQLGSLITDFNATNAFFSTNVRNIVTTGYSAAETVPDDTTYRARFEELLGFGNSSYARLVGGVYEDRVFYVNVWAGETPTTAQYIRHLSDGRIFTPQGAVVDFWNVRPDRMCETVDLLDPGPVNTAPDAAARFYVERVSFRADESGMGVTLEPEASNSLDAQLANLSQGRWR